MADHMNVKFSLAIGGCFTLKPRLGVIACEYPDKLYGPETRVIFLPDAENCRIVYLFVWTKHRNVTE